MTEKPRKLTHADDRGDLRMVDVGNKPTTRRTAIAEGLIRMHPDTLEAIRNNSLEKGEALAAARIAGIMAAKRTADWIPLCHPLQIDRIDVSLSLDSEISGVVARAQTDVTARTGAEMEALVAVSAALLTVYDMCKGIDREMEIGTVRLVEKRGGRSGTWRRRHR